MVVVPFAEMLLSYPDGDAPSPAPDEGDEPFGLLASTKKQLRLHAPQNELSSLYSPRFTFI